MMSQSWKNIGDIAGIVFHQAIYGRILRDDRDDVKGGRGHSAARGRQLVLPVEDFPSVYSHGPIADLMFLYAVDFRKLTVHRCHDKLEGKVLMVKIGLYWSFDRNRLDMKYIEGTVRQWYMFNVGAFIRVSLGNLSIDLVKL